MATRPPRLSTGSFSSGVRPLRSDVLPAASNAPDRGKPSSRWPGANRWGVGASLRFCTALVVLSLGVGGWAQSPPNQNKLPAPPPGASLIKHFVFLIKENHSFDNYFGQFPGAAGATKGKLSDGKVVTLGPMPDTTSHDIGHTTANTLTGMDNGKMDGFDLIDLGNDNGDLLAYRQFGEAGIPNYWYYAQHFTLADEMFSSYHGPSYPNHFYTVGATSNGILDLPVDWLAPGPGHGVAVGGCDATPTTSVRTLDAEGNIDADFTCFDFETLVDELQAADLSWNYYAPGYGEEGYIFSVLDAINHIRNSQLWTDHVVSDTQFESDALAGNLPAVSWVVTGAADEHPPHSTCRGENWSVQQINAVMQGADWDSTAIILVWDDFGGQYDHAVPPSVDGFGFGPRVPMLIISPYSKPGYISHTRYEFSSVLKTIEQRFGLAPLTQRDMDANALWNSFNFQQTPNPPQVLQPRECPFASTNYVQFGEQGIGTPSPVQSVPLTNNGNVGITIDNIVAAGDYTQTHRCPKVLQPTYSCDISVVFTPTVLGADPGTLTVTDSDPTSPQVISLNGTGSQVNLNLSYPGLDFQTVTFGSTLTEPVVMTNLSSAPVTISRFGFVGYAAQDFSQSTTCSGAIPPGGTCQWSISFTPTPKDYAFVGVEHASFVIEDSAVGSPHSMRLTGIGTALKLSPLSQLNFGDQELGTTSAPMVLKVKNTGMSAITVGSIVTVGDYSIQNNTCGTGIAPETTCQVSVTFSPQISGTDNGVLNLNDNDTASPQRVLLLGTGTTTPSARLR
ncbi:MAG: alkaline phosphatase family protein [Terriglobales bacterium]